MADITFLQATVGAQTGLTDGNSVAVRLNRQNGLYTAEASASLQEAALRGRAFGVANQAGVTSQAGLSASTPVLTLYNPLSSGVNGVLWYASANCTVAPATVGLIWLAANTNTAAAAVTGTLTTAHRNLLLGASNNPAIIPYLAATLPAAPVALCQLGVNYTGAVTTAPVVGSVERWINGAIILKPGTAVSIQTGVASGASGLFCEFLWEEIAV